MHLSPSALFKAAVALAAAVGCAALSPVAAAAPDAGSRVSLSVPRVSLRVVPVGGEDKPAFVSLAYPQTTDGKLAASSTDKLNVLLKLTDAATSLPFTAQHVALAVANLAAGRAATFLLTSSSEKGSYNLALDLTSEAVLQKLSKPSGNHSLTLYISDARAEPFLYHLGFASLDTSLVPAIPPTEADDVFEPLPPITHKMRPAEKLPAAAVSYVFTGLTLAPWLGLLAVWAMLGANIRNLAESPANFVYGTGFFGALAALLVVFYLYWTQLTLFQLMAYASVVGLFTALLGRQALVSRAEVRAKLAQ
ncbi:Oligosaccharyltransferase subunit Ribophorin II-domain-containing protein [Entophlyctis helioformis]|nr:Oligosaccharyltransferase subunit Ribophorin II-domain-containing protein [Entophlyctis helioformis]